MEWPTRHFSTHTIPERIGYFAASCTNPTCTFMDCFPWKKWTVSGFVCPEQTPSQKGQQGGQGLPTCRTRSRFDRFVSFPHRRILSRTQLHRQQDTHSSGSRALHEHLRQLAGYPPPDRLPSGDQHPVNQSPHRHVQVRFGKGFRSGFSDAAEPLDLISFSFAGPQLHFQQSSGPQ